MIRKLTRISPASCVAMVALFVALGGVSYAAVGQIGTADIKNGAITKVKIKKDAVTGAKVKESSLGIVPNAANAENAAKLDGKVASAFESKGFSSPADDLANLPSNTNTTVATQSLPAGTYLVLARGGLNNNGGSNAAAGEKCSLSAGNGVQTIQFGALAKNGQPGDREEFSMQVIATLDSPGAATLSCDMSGSWESGNVTDPSVVAVSLQP
jgi:hypothetical protein